MSLTVRAGCPVIVKEVLMAFRRRRRFGRGRMRFGRRRGRSGMRRRLRIGNRM